MAGTQDLPPDLEELIGRVVEYFEPQAVILFGSHGRGEAGPDSDIDLLVIVDDDAPVEKRRLSAGRKARRGWYGMADIVPVTRSRYEEGRRVIGSLAEIASAEGRRVYGRA
ncbi:nucleotidyltransferase domain-containing protein [Geminicoccus roseus]|uniref:nucleotidyltransferase domain-containing protein n=1 Tax=Geminicoccus roseus TaxID=404900 RepID=UPI000422C345|nr:nucleotidyltransferase domain-containing protein [Geminicoccus roseus]